MSLSAAVRRVRRAYGDTQERFGQRLHLSLMTVSKFERGARVPKDPMVLSGLARAARVADLLAEAKQFEDAIGTQGRSRASMAVEDARFLQSGINDLAWRLVSLRDHALTDYDEIIQESIDIVRKLQNIVGLP